MSHETELFWAALRRAAHMGASSEPVAKLRAYVHNEMLAGRIAGDTADRLADLLDTVEEYEQVREGDFIGPNATDIAWNVVEVENGDGTWRRLFGPDRLDDGNEWDWALVSRNGLGDVGYSTTDALIPGTYGRPLRVTKVVRHPAGGSR